MMTTTRHVTVVNYCWDRRAQIDRCDSKHGRSNRCKISWFMESQKGDLNTFYDDITIFRSHRRQSIFDRNAMEKVLIARQLNNTLITIQIKNSRRENANKNIFCVQQQRRENLSMIECDQASRWWVEWMCVTLSPFKSFN